MREIDKEVNNKGVALIVVMLLMFLMLSLAFYFLSFSLTEEKMANSQEWGVRTYHLAEAGVADMLWKLKNNETYKTNFMNDADWVKTISRNEPFGEEGTFYEATIRNTDKGKGEITATGTIEIANDRISQRVVKSKVYKAIPADDSATSTLDLHEAALFAEEEIAILHSEVKIGGSLYSNDDIHINGFGTDVYVSGDIKAVDRFSKSFGAEVNVSGIIMDSYNYSPAPEEVEMPTVSFDEDDPDSFKNRADFIYSEDEFEDLMDNADDSLTFGTDSSPKIIYVTGDIIFDNDLDVNIYGALVAEEDIYVGKGSGFFNLVCNDEYTSLSINFVDGYPVGLIAKDDITFGFCLEDKGIESVIYAGRQVVIQNFTNSIDITGGIFGRTIDIFSVWNDVDMNYDEYIIGSTLYTTEYAPIIEAEHWEEEY